jgi:predicted RNA-binding protein with EMAP domain
MYGHCDDVWKPLKEVKGMQDASLLQEEDLLQKASRCIEYIQEALQNRDYATAVVEMSELRFLMAELQELDRKKMRRAQLFDVVSDMRQRGIKIDFVSQMLG